MILIYKEEIKDIEGYHYKAIQPYAAAVLKLYIALFDAIGNGQVQRKNSNDKVDVLSNQTLHHSTIYASVRVLFDKTVSEDDITIDLLEKILTTGKSPVQLSITDSKAKLLFTLFSSVLTELDDILKGSAEVLQKIVDRNVFSFPKDTIELDCINWVFNYKRFRKDGFKLNGKRWDAYTLTSELGLSVCPYCNRNWIVTVTEENETGSNIKIVNPQLDHFFSQEEQPLFAVSFYNLIPSCEACNARLKKSIQFNFHDFLHPYVNCYGKTSYFDTIPRDLASQQGKAGNFMVRLHHDRNIDPLLKAKIQKNHETFQIENIYQQHGDVIADLYRKKYLYSTDYVRVLCHTIDGEKINPDEVYRVAFGNYLSEKDFNNRPFAKLTRDIIENLGLFQMEHE